MPKKNKKDEAEHAKKHLTSKSEKIKEDAPKEKEHKEKVETKVQVNVGDKVRVVAGADVNYPGIKDQVGIVDRQVENGDYVIKFDMGMGCFLMKNFKAEDLSKE